MFCIIVPVVFTLLKHELKLMDGWMDNYIETIKAIEEVYIQLIKRENRSIKLNKYAIIIGNVITI